MATRIGFHAVFSTSEDHEHPAKELDQQGPHTRGWKSRQFCIYPQELAFKLASRTHVSKIQLLLHQLLIPEKIEFHIGDVERGKDASYANAKFTLLGSVSPATNEESGHRAREVTAVAVDCEGLFVKLVIHRNHLNKANKFNQVSIMGINFLGEEKETNNNTVGKEAAGAKDPSLPNYEDLTFNMYVDHECVKYMQKLEAKKATAAKNERFEYAKNCRDAVGLLHTAGLRLGKYHIEKRMAIEDESYDRAKLKKDHAEEYKEAVMEALRIDQLLESDGMDPKNNKTMNLELPPPPGKKKKPPTPPPEPERPKSDPLPPIPLTPEHRESSSHSVKKPMTPPPPINNPPAPMTPPAPKTPPAPVPAPVPAHPPAPVHAPIPAPRGRSPPPPPRYQPAPVAPSPMPIPRIRSPRMHQDPISRRKLMAGMMVGEVGGSNPRQHSSILSDHDRKAAALPIEVFGEPLVESFYSKSFVQKEEGFRNLMTSLRTDDSIKADKKTRAATFLLLRGLRDKMYTVCQQAVEVLAYLTGPFANKHKTSSRELNSTLEAATPELIQKLGENATRVQAMASESLLQLADTAAHRGLPAVCDALAAPLKGHSNARLAQARIETLEKIVIKHGVSPSGPHFSSHVAEFAISALDQPSDQVRAAGSRLLVLIYPEDKRLVRSMLPSNGQTKNSSYRTLLAELDRIDGKRGVASLRFDSPAELRSVEEEDEEEEEYEDDGEEDEYQQALRAEAEQERLEQEHSRQQERQQERQGRQHERQQEENRPAPMKENPAFSRSLRSKALQGALAGVNSSANSDDGSTCVFCGVTDERFETEEGMEYHFWKTCPLLTRCKDCKQAVEVSEYTEHKLRDCKEHKNYKCCKRCKEAVPKGDYDYHVRSYQCIPAKSGPAGNHCPLCHQNTPPYEDGFKQHLLEDCKNNCRNPQGLARAGRGGSTTTPPGPGLVAGPSRGGQSTRDGGGGGREQAKGSRAGRIQSELHSRRRGSLTDQLAPTPQPPPAPRRANSDLGPTRKRTPPGSQQQRRTPPGGQRTGRTPPAGGDRKTPPGGRKPQQGGKEERKTPPGGRQNRTPPGGRQGKTPPSRNQQARTPPTNKAPAKRSLAGKIQSTRTPPGGRQPTKTPPKKSNTPPSRERGRPAAKQQTPKTTGRHQSVPASVGRTKEPSKSDSKRAPAGGDRGREPKNAGGKSRIEVPQDRRSRSQSVSRIPTKQWR